MTRRPGGYHSNVSGVLARDGQEGEIAEHNGRGSLADGESAELQLGHGEQMSEAATVPRWRRRPAPAETGQKDRQRCQQEQTMRKARCPAPAETKTTAETSASAEADEEIRCVIVQLSR